MSSGSSSTGSASISSDGSTTEFPVALEIDPAIQLSCPCGLCEKERKIWLGVPNNFQKTWQLIARIMERYHLTSNIRLFFSDYYMPPEVPIPISNMRKAGGILRALTHPNGVSREGHYVLNRPCPQYPGTMTSPESSPVAGLARRMGKGAVMLDSSSSSSSSADEDDQNVPKRSGQGGAGVTTSGAGTSNNAQQDVNRRKNKNGMRSSGAVRVLRVTNPSLYVESSPESHGETEDPNWFPGGSTTSSNWFPGDSTSSSSSF